MNCQLPPTWSLCVCELRTTTGRRSELRDELWNVADAHAGIEEQRLLRADDEIRDDFFGLVRLVDGENARRNFVDFKPRLVRQHAFERFVFRARESFAPIRAIARIQEKRRGEKFNAEHTGGHRVHREEGGEQETMRDFISEAPGRRWIWEASCARLCCRRLAR